jgi:hypothetical protein
MLLCKYQNYASRPYCMKLCKPHKDECFSNINSNSKSSKKIGSFKRPSFIILLAYNIYYIFFYIFEFACAYSSYIISILADREIHLGHLFHLVLGNDPDFPLNLLDDCCCDYLVDCYIYYRYH